MAGSHLEFILPRRTLPKKTTRKRPKSPPTGFAKLDVSRTMLAALAKAGYEEPTPIQAGLIPLAFDGVDVLGQARTGTGKTAAFAIPIIEEVLPVQEEPNPQALILVPTRELAVQVRDEIAKLSDGRQIHAVAVYGGKSIRGQAEKLKAGAQIVVGTPGRVLDMIGRRVLILSRLEWVVLDEADRMLDIGFRPDIEKILRQCPKERQTLLLSATVPPPIEKLAQKYMYKPEKLNFSPKDVTVDTIDQYYFTVVREKKFDLLVKLLDREKPKQAIIFCRTKRGTEKIFQRLRKRLKSVGCIHGDMQQRERDRVMGEFRAEKLTHLVATDVIGRGIDITSVSHIVNYDIPQFSDDYVHRVGRTGRMGREGVAYTFVTPEEGNELTRIEDRINRLLKRDEIADFDAAAPPERADDSLDDDDLAVPLPKTAPPPPPGKRRVRTRRRAL